MMMWVGDVTPMRTVMMTTMSTVTMMAMTAVVVAAVSNGTDASRGR